MQKTLAQEAYDKIRSRLASGELAPGTRLVNRRLAKEIGMSAMPVREAIHRLASEGLLTHVAGAGAYVRQPDVQELLELHGLREALETYAAEEAARNVTSEELGVMDRVCAEGREILMEVSASQRPYATAAQTRRWADCEERFHNLLITAARSRVLAETVRRQRVLTNIFKAMRAQCEAMTPAMIEQTCREHEAIVEALRRRDGDEARRLIALQVRSSREDLLHQHGGRS